MLIVNHHARRVGVVDHNDERALVGMVTPMDLLGVLKEHLPDMGDLCTLPVSALLHSIGVALRGRARAVGIASMTSCVGLPLFSIAFRVRCPLLGGY